MSFWDALGGAVAGVLGKIIYDIRATNQECEKLDRGIKAEVKVLKNSMKTECATLDLYLHIVSSRDPITEPYKALPEFKMSFTEEKLEKMGMLDSAFLDPLVEMRAMLEVFLPEALQNVLDIQSEVMAGNENRRPTLILLVEGAIATCNRIDKICDKLLEFEGNYSTTDTLFKYIRNRIKNIINGMEKILKRLFS